MLAILGLGNGELIIILVILLLMFGATKLPQLARGLGKSVKEFKKASNEEPAGDDDDASSKQLKSRAVDDAEDAVVDRASEKTRKS